MGHNHSHHHHHNHGHHHPELKGTNLSIAILLNVLITVSQIIGALYSKSLSLMTDALHNLSDVMALIISWVANKLSKRESTHKETFGYKRAEILAAFINAATLLGISVYLIVEAVERLMGGSSIAVKGDMVIWLALLSIVANGLSVLLIQKDAKHSMNMKAAYLHLFSDMLTSIAVLIGGLMMKYYGFYWVDSILSIMIAIYLIISSWKLVIGATKVLMQFAPSHINLNDIVESIKKIEGVKGLHHIHIWQLSDHENHFEAHIELDKDLKLSEVDAILNIVRHELSHHYNISHHTLQAEYNVCNDKSIINLHE
ncbi:cation diffusion facilitator family transporter [Saccharicrinis aurantiacus]|uniref:cation diffusion facilitator family transporter n=1 Tax=Saccharicrinis aurantiacus TaxID=1849719 RepID=UPI0008388B8E|nr:cation diffusion facilitator family transporter [Saccharicrinis aurantiacus]